MNHREIKLKAWDNNQRAFVPLVALLPDETRPVIQFTGVYDANGREIWEGDVLYYRHYDDRENKVYESWHEVVFQNGAFGSMLSVNDFQSFSEQTDDGQIDELVVGNVFENPQMLNRK